MTPTATACVPVKPLPLAPPAGCVCPAVPSCAHPAAVGMGEKPAETPESAASAASDTAGAAQDGGQAGAVGEQAVPAAVIHVATAVEMASRAAGSVVEHDSPVVTRAATASAVAASGGTSPEVAATGPTAKLTVMAAAVAGCSCRRRDAAAGPMPGATADRPSAHTAFHTTARARLVTFSCRAMAATSALPEAVATKPTTSEGAQKGTGTPTMTYRAGAAAAGLADGDAVALRDGVVPTLRDGTAEEVPVPLPVRVEDGATDTVRVADADPAAGPDVVGEADAGATDGCRLAAVADADAGPLDTALVTVALGEPPGAVVEGEALVATVDVPVVLAPVGAAVAAELTGEPVGLADAVLVAVGVLEVELLGEGDGVVEPEPEGEGASDADADVVGLLDGDEPVLMDAVGDEVADGVGAAEDEPLPLQVPDGESEPDGDAVAELDAVCDGASDVVAELDEDAVGDTVDCAVTEALTDGAWVDETDPLADGDGDGVPDTDAEGDRDEDADGELEGVADAVTDGELEEVDDGVTDGVADGVTEDVMDGVADGVTEDVKEGVADGVTEGVTEGVTLGVGVGDGSGDGTAATARNCVLVAAVAMAVHTVSEVFTRNMRFALATALVMYATTVSPSRRAVTPLQVHVDHERCTDHEVTEPVSCSRPCAWEHTNTVAALYANAWLALVVSGVDAMETVAMAPEVVALGYGLAADPRAHTNVEHEELDCPASSIAPQLVGLMPQ
jgi:hypothetical protein